MFAYRLLSNQIFKKDLISYKESSPLHGSNFEDELKLV